MPLKKKGKGQGTKDKGKKVCSWCKSTHDQKNIQLIDNRLTHRKCFEEYHRSHT